MIVKRIITIIIIIVVLVIVANRDRNRDGSRGRRLHQLLLGGREVGGLLLADAGRLRSDDPHPGSHG